MGGFRSGVVNGARLAAVIGSLGAPVLAAHGASDPPEACRAGAPARGYGVGHRTGRFLVEMAWRQVDDCGETDEFRALVRRVVGDLTLPLHPSTYASCRFGGIVDGAMAALADASFACEQQCFADGEAVGTMAAEAYCELSLALDGLASADHFLGGPVDTCGVAFEDACDQHFVGSAEAYVSEQGECYPFTVEDFFPIFNQTRLAQCAGPEPDRLQHDPSEAGDAAGMPTGLGANRE